MSQECRRIIKDNGICVFSVIALPDGLSTADYKLGLEYGPADVEVEDGYTALLEATGWRLEERIDLTDAYIVAIDRMRVEEEAQFEALAELQGKETVEARIARRVRRLKALELGVVIREQFITRPI